MPIYEYVCHTGSHRFEVRQKFNDPPLISCIHCGEAVTKLISAPAIMFKGSGWYVTDYSGKLKPGDAQPPSAGDNEKKPDTAAQKTEKTDGATASPATSTSSATTATTGSPTPSS